MTNSAPSAAGKGDLTQGSISAHLVRLSVPMIWGIMALISFQLVDTFFVARLGTEKLAALTFTFPLSYIIFSFILGFGISMSSVAARLIGEGNPHAVKRVVTHGLLIGFLAGSLLTLLGYLHMESIFTAMGADEDMLAKILKYMRVWFLGPVFVATWIIGNAAIRAGGDTKTPALIMGSVALTNLVLDPILIFGLFGFPRLELQGAAIATICGEILGAFIALYVLYGRKKLLLSPRYPELETFKNSFKRIISIALPVGITNTIYPLVNAFIIGILSASGSAAVAAFGIASRIEAFAFIILMALSIGMGPIISQNFGAKNFARTKETLKLAIGFNVLWSACVAVILGVLAKPIAGLFSSDPHVIAYMTLFFWIVPFSYAFSNLVNSWCSAFNAMGKPRYSFTMIVVKMLLLMIPALCLGYDIGGPQGLFIAMAAVNLLTGTTFHLWSQKRLQKIEIGD